MQPASAPHASDSTSVSVFYDALAPYGEWETLAPYGWVWSPHDVAADWRPYTLGRWVLADDVGWTWVGDEPWAWAPYHYGRWMCSETLGWVWIPGTTWAPAWVAWRSNPEMVGWAPLPPDAVWDANVGIVGGCSTYATSIDSFGWSFCAFSDFGAPHCEAVIVEPARNVTLIRRTRVIDNLILENGRPVQCCLDVARLERERGERIERVHIRDSDDIGPARVSNPHELAFFRRSLEPAAETRRPPEREFAAEREHEREAYDSFRKRETEVYEHQHADALARLKEAHERELGRAQGAEAIRDLREQHAAELQQMELHHRRALALIDRRARFGVRPRQ